LTQSTSTETGSTTTGQTKTGQTFSDFGLNPLILKALNAKGYTQPTPIQQQSIPGVMSGRDLLGIAQTGTGKTAAFALPILHRLAMNRKAAPKGGCRCLVLSPTRELATQIAESFRLYGAELGFSVATIFGGVSAGPQIKSLARGIDIIVAAPGRLLDHLGQGACKLSGLEIFVLDEADQMLDMGFIVPIRKIVKYLPRERTNLFFSATMPQDIGKLAGELLNDPLKVSVAPQATTAERVNQQVVMIEAGRKKGLLIELFQRPDFRRVLVFTRTKRGADKVTRILEGAGVKAQAIHGNKSQNQRERALQEFKQGDVRALVATDIAARGIDISSVTHVVQYELPDVPEQYVHRIGRTARAGKDGSAVAFCADDERGLLRDVERVTRQKIPSIDRRGDAALGALAASSPEPKAESHADPRRPQRGGGGQRDGQRQGQRNGQPRGEQARGEGRGGKGPGQGRGQRNEPRRDGAPRAEARGDGPRGEGNRSEGRNEPRRDDRRPAASAPNNQRGMDRPLQGRKPHQGARAPNGFKADGHRKGPRNDVASAGAGGPVTPAAALIRHLATSNPWQKD
jgi:ATP-dependent RNA helicase RhlE